MELRFDPDTGLIPAIAQDRLTGEIRMVAFMNREALRLTLETGDATFYSRSRKALWRKGESSGHTLRVERVVADCDADVLLLEIDPNGPSCHTGRPSCFFQHVGREGRLEELRREAAPFARVLEGVIEDRTESTAQKSYTKSLLDAGAGKIGEKLREEADELARAIANESDDRVLSEAGDLVYHVLVGLRSRGLPLRAVLEKLCARSHQSGLTEKASRRTPE